ncbi:Glycosyltransferase [Rhodovulum sp. P5]|nr:Glycosyltransferase [Rhodovulum sp. P5]
MQISCHNDQSSLPVILDSIPQQIDGVGKVEIQLIDDSSTDATVDIALCYGVEHIVRHKAHSGLSHSFQTGLDNALAAGADIIVTIDGGNRCGGRGVPELVRPIVEGRADIVMGHRDGGDASGCTTTDGALSPNDSGPLRRFPWVRRRDAAAGPRAYSRDAALAMTVMPRTSDADTLIHARQHGLSVISAPLQTISAPRRRQLLPLRPFRVLGAVTSLKGALYHRPAAALLAAGLVLLILGAAACVAPLLVSSYSSNPVAFAVLGGALVLAGYLTLVAAYLGTALAANRRLTETLLIRLRQMETAPRPAGRAHQNRTKSEA